MKTALVTGSNGFVGRHMVDYLVDLDYEVRCVDIAYDGLSAVEYFHFADEVYDLAVHCAYKVGGRATIDGTNLNLADNLILDAELFNWAVRTQQRAILYFSSSAVYPTHFQGQYCHKNLEERDLSLDVANPDANYGWAKVTGERLAKAANELGLRVHVVRPFSGYGADQSLDYPFPSIIRRARNNDLTVWGPPGQTRDWIHIDDVVRAAYAVYRDDDRRPVNLCTGVGTEMGALAKTAWDLAFDRGFLGLPHHNTAPVARPQVTYDICKPTGVRYRVGNPTRMLEHYTPEISVEDGIKLALRKD